jgi:1,4-dihydroxy-6-naphthoate synthase
MTTRDFDVTAVSFHAYAYISEHYALLPSGASIGDGYGPIVVARENIPPGELATRKIAVPGTLTSAYLALRLHTPQFEYVVVPFDRIIDAVAGGQADAGLLIHEGQLTYHEKGLKKVLISAHGGSRRLVCHFQWEETQSGASWAKSCSVADI